MTKCIEAIEKRMQPTSVNQTAHDHNPLRNRRSNNPAKYASIAHHDCCISWEYGEFQHF